MAERLRTYQLEPQCNIGDMQSFSSSWCGRLQEGQRVGKSFPAKISFEVERDDGGRREHCWIAAGDVLRSQIKLSTQASIFECTRASSKWGPRSFKTAQVGIRRQSSAYHLHWRVSFGIEMSVTVSTNCRFNMYAWQTFSRTLAARKNEYKQKLPWWHPEAWSPHSLVSHPLTWRCDTKYRTFWCKKGQITSDEL